MRSDPRITSHLAETQADLQTRLLVLEDAFLVTERAVEDLLGHLVAQGLLGPEADLVKRWRENLRILRERGLPKRPLPGETPAAGVTCPSCQSLLRTVTGAAGDRCDWCGYVFPFCCPSCGRELTGVTGAPGEVCLWCHHQLG